MEVIAKLVELESVVLIADTEGEGEELVIDCSSHGHEGWKSQQEGQASFNDIE